MKLIYLLSLTLLQAINVFGQTSYKKDLIQLGKDYKDYMFRNKPDAKFLKKFNKNFSNDLKEEVRFIKETISSNNKLLEDTYLTVPKNQVLKNIYVIRAINLNLREEDRVDNNKLIDSLNKADIPKYELIDNYYNMLFTAVGNKNQPFDFSNVNFTLNKYKFNDDVEQGIFFLRCMDLCGKSIWGYMNIVKPPNTEKTLANIKKYPKFNNKPYFQFTDLYFKDFEMIIIKDKGKQSYKAYYLDKYFETLIFHLISLDKENGSQEEIKDLLLGSILKESGLYRYTKYKETLESIFQEQKKD